MSVFERFRRRRAAIVCRQAVALMSDYLDDRLPTGDALRLEAHLAGCPHCSEYLRQLRLTLDALGRIDPDDVAPEVLEEIVDIYRQWRAG